MSPTIAGLVGGIARNRLTILFSVASKNNWPSVLGGSRVCLGKKMAFLLMKRVVAKVLLRFRVVPPAEDGLTDHRLIALTPPPDTASPLALSPRRARRVAAAAHQYLPYSPFRRRELGSSPFAATSGESWRYPARLPLSPKITIGLAAPVVPSIARKMKLALVSAKNSPPLPLFSL
ncbi:hypothetical protein NL676_030695 [Syzygium grande]|nr:hypothetical protein NL676_030695 [Syzygium grande]